MVDIFQEIRSKLDTLHDSLTESTYDRMGSGSDLIDAKVAAAEARTDTKFAQFDGKLDLILAEVRQSAKEVSEMKADNKATRSTVRNTGYALAGLIVAVVALLAATALAMPGVFGMGATMRDAVASEVQRQMPIHH